MTRVTPTFWARAFRKALAEKKTDEETLVRATARLMQTYGVSRDHDKILRKISEEIIHFYGGQWITVETARPITRDQQKKIAGAFSEKDYIEERVRPELVAGVRILIDGEREYDGSLKRKLDRVL